MRTLFFSSFKYSKSAVFISLGNQADQEELFSFRKYLSKESVTKYIYVLS